MKKIMGLVKKYKEIILYLLFGVCTTLVNWVVYAIMVKGLELNMIPANAVAWVAAVTFAFFTNKVWVFESKSWDAKTAIREALSFYAARIVTGIIEIFLPTGLYKIGLDRDLFGVKGFAAKIIVSIIVIILNYVFSKLFVFRKSKNKRKEQTN